MKEGEGERGRRRKRGREIQSERVEWRKKCQKFDKPVIRQNSIDPLKLFMLVLHLSKANIAIGQSPFVLKVQKHSGKAAFVSS